MEILICVGWPPPASASSVETHAEDYKSLSVGENRGPAGKTRSGAD